MHEMKLLNEWASAGRPVLLTPWFPLKQMVGWDEQPCRERQIISCEACLAVNSKQAHKHTHTYRSANTLAHTHTHRMFCGLHCLYECYIFLHCGFITAIPKHVYFSFCSLLFFMSAHSVRSITVGLSVCAPHVSFRALWTAACADSRFEVCPAQLVYSSWLFKGYFDNYRCTDSTSSRGSDT